MPVELLVGLGNPGEGYYRTRHNVGFMVLEEIRRRHHARWRLGPGGKLARFVIDHRTITALRPATYMNSSGRAVSACACKLEIIPANIMIIYDDLDLPLGRIRLGIFNSSGGHRGVQSVIEHLDSSEFKRLRVGIGRPPREISAREHVLSGFTGEEIALAEDVVQLAGDALEVALDEGVKRAMSLYNGCNLDDGV